MVYGSIDTGFFGIIHITDLLIGGHSIYLCVCVCVTLVCSGIILRAMVDGLEHDLIMSAHLTKTKAYSRFVYCMFMLKLGPTRELLLPLIGFWFSNANTTPPCGDSLAILICAPFPLIALTDRQISKLNH